MRASGPDSLSGRLGAVMRGNDGTGSERRRTCPSRIPADCLYWRRLTRKAAQSERRGEHRGPHHMLRLRAGRFRGGRGVSQLWPPHAGHIGREDRAERKRVGETPRTDRDPSRRGLHRRVYGGDNVSVSECTRHVVLPRDRRGLHRIHHLHRRTIELENAVTPTTRADPAWEPGLQTCGPWPPFG